MIEIFGSLAAIVLFAFILMFPLDGYLDFWVSHFSGQAVNLSMFAAFCIACADLRISLFIVVLSFFIIEFF